MAGNRFWMEGTIGFASGSRLESKNKFCQFRCVVRLSEQRLTLDVASGSVQHPKELDGVIHWIPCVLRKTRAYSVSNDLESIF